jgi:hypothetical protein
MSYLSHHDRRRRKRSYSQHYKVLDTSKPPKGLEQLYAIGAQFDCFHKNGQGFMARCPAHADNNPSLSINLGRNGVVVIHCQAGCDTAEVLQAVDLYVDDLMPGAPYAYLGDGYGGPAGAQTKTAATTATSTAETKAETKTKHGRRIVATYDYRDEAGKVLYQVVRYEPKDFRQRSPDGEGGWVWTTQGVRKVPYRLPRLLRTNRKYACIVEGEKDADRLIELGLCATTNVGGAGKWLPEYNVYLAGEHVVIFPDNDEAGRQHAADLIRNLSGVVASLKVIELPGLPDKGDVSDWLDAGHTADELCDLIDNATPLPISVIKIIPVVPPEAIAGSQSSSPQRKPPQLGEDAYHGLAGQFVRAVAPYTEATDVCVLMHLLPAVGTLVGAIPYIHKGNKQYARINTVAVGPTNAGRKGTGFAPVDLLMKKVVEDDNQYRAFWDRQRVNGLSSGEGLIAFVADRESEDKKTGERISSPAEKRVYVLEEEFSRLFVNMSREGNCLSQVVRSAYDDGNLHTLTVEGRHAHGAHISINGHITLDELLERLSPVEMKNGWCNRFLWYHTKSDKVLPDAGPFPDRVFLPDLIRRLQTLLFYGGRGGKQVVPLSKEASALWREVYPRLRQDRPGLAGAMTSRGAPMVLRLALIYALLDNHPITENNQLKGLHIRVAHLRAAMAVWDYCEESAYYFLANRSGDALGDKVLELLTAGPMTRNEFNKHLSAKQKERLPAVLEMLLASGLVRRTEVKHDGPGRPVERWKRV